MIPGTNCKLQNKNFNSVKVHLFRSILEAEFPYSTLIHLKASATDPGCSKGEWSHYMYGPYGPYWLYGPYGPWRALRALTDLTGPLRAPYGHLRAPSNSPETDFTWILPGYFRYWNIVIHVEVISLFLPLLALEIRHRQEHFDISQFRIKKFC